MVIATVIFIRTLLERLDTASGTRDIDNLPFENDNDEMELYWDIILLTESQFLLSAALGSDKSSKQVLKSFQKHTVKKIGESLNSIVKQSKPTTGDRSWRNLGCRYYMVYLPLHFSDVIWCKSGTTYFHVILPENHPDCNERKQSNEKEWLLALLELASSFDLDFMRLYIRRDDLNGVSTFLRNLNWIGGKLVPNEDRDQYIINSACSHSDFEEMLLGDESFVILEFEC